MYPNRISSSGNATPLVSIGCGIYFSFSIFVDVYIANIQNKNYIEEQITVFNNP